MASKKTRGRPRKNGVKEENDVKEENETRDEVQSSDYEQLRQQRIKENRERMEKMGILALSAKLKPQCPPPKRHKPAQTKPPCTSSPARRSSRLTTADRVDYAEKSIMIAKYVIIPAVKKERRGGARVSKSKKGRKELDDEEICITESLNPEVYTEEHEQLLGDCKMKWTLNVDGYDEDGQRIYDQFQGKHCHQCRQITLGHHTKCSKCEADEVQLCGDCLFTRYGENVIEANENMSWTCPVCRGICNCSRCRRAKGWKPTGDIYWKVKKLGFKSVAHYLIETRREQKTEELADGESKLVDVESSQSDHSSVEEKTEVVDGSQALADEESKLIDVESSQSDRNSVEDITEDNEHGGSDEDFNANNSDNSSEDESDDYSS